MKHHKARILGWELPLLLVGKSPTLVQEGSPHILGHLQNTRNLLSCWTPLRWFLFEGPYEYKWGLWHCVEETPR